MLLVGSGVGRLRVILRLGRSGYLKSAIAIGVSNVRDHHDGSSVCLCDFVYFVGVGATYQCYSVATYLGRGRDSKYALAVFMFWKYRGTP